MGMRKHGMFEIIENRALTSDIFLMRMAGDTGACKAPGQFINILLDGVYLRRPISVCDYQVGEITIIYRVVGKGTALLGEMKPGGMLDALTGLGNGYSIPGEIKAPLIIGGGVGIPPLYGLAKALLRKGLKPVAALGFANSGDIFFLKEFERLGCRLILATDDGSAGFCGYITDAVLADGARYDYVYSCGPKPMLHAVFDMARTDGQFSFEERMGCGFGACMGCTCNTKHGPKRVCADGPVFLKEEIVW